jgi:hypothetical protein
MQASALDLSVAPAARLRSVALLADASVITERTTGRADEGAGRHVAVNRFGDNGTGQSAACGTLRVGRQAGAAVAIVASRETGDQKNSAGKAQSDRFLHSLLPVLLARDWTVDAN